MYRLLPKCPENQTNHDHSPESTATIPSQYLGEAVFAGGSFWGLEVAYGLVDGVVKTATGYCGGTLQKPTHKEVCEGRTGHTEAVKVIFDKRRVSYKDLCDHFWETHDPTNKQYLNFGIGTHYQSAIFYTDEKQRKQAQESKIRRQMKLNKRIVTKMYQLESNFFLAETQHQKYYLQMNSNRACELLNLRSTEQFIDSYTACKLNGILSLSGNEDIEYLKRFVEGAEWSKPTKLVCEGILEDLDGIETKRKFI